MKEKPVEPNERVILVALSGAVMIFTPDNHFVLLKPEAARRIAKDLVALAGQAEIAGKDPSLGRPYQEYFRRFIKKAKGN